MPAPRKASVGWARDAADLSAALRGLASPKVQAAILESAVKAACQPILTAAKRFAKRSEATGALRDSLTLKTVTYMNNGKPVAVGMVGPDRAYRAKGRKVKGLRALLAAAKGELRKPANYAHLVEFGHRIANGGFVAPKPFLRPAVITTRAQQSAAFEKAIAAGLDRELRKLNRKGGAGLTYKSAA